MNDGTNPDDTYTAVHLTDPGELIGAIPMFLGIHPTQSLVLVPYAAIRRDVELVVRTDLPSLADIPALASHLQLAIRNITAPGNRAEPERLDTVAAVIIDGNHSTHHPLPHRALVETLVARLANDGIQVTHPLWASAATPGENWRCYDPCRCHGAVPDMDASVLAAVHAVVGKTPPRSREQLAAILAADPADRIARRAALLASHRAHAPHGAGPAEDVTTQAGLQVMRAAIAAATTHHGPPDLDDEQIADIVIALRSPEVRDQCLESALSDQPSSAERLWTVLTRATPPPDRAEPAFLLAVHAALRGDGVFANVALDIAMTANPEHGPARLLHLALRAGITPVALRRVVAEAVSSTP